jgi:aconitate hydratase
VVALDYKNPDDHRMLQALALVAQGILALTFADESDYDRAEVGQVWRLADIRQALADGAETITALIVDADEEIRLTHDFSEHEREILVAGGLLSYLREREGSATRH